MRHVCLSTTTRHVHTSNINSQHHEPTTRYWQVYKVRLISFLYSVYQILNSHDDGEIELHRRVFCVGFNVTRSLLLVACHFHCQPTCWPPHVTTTPTTLLMSGPFTFPPPSQVQPPPSLAWNASQRACSAQTCLPSCVSSIGGHSSHTHHPPRSTPCSKRESEGLFLPALTLLRPPLPHLKCESEGIFYQSPPSLNFEQQSSDHVGYFLPHPPSNHPSLKTWVIGCFLPRPSSAWWRACLCPWPPSLTQRRAHSESFMPTSPSLAFTFTPPS